LARRDGEYAADGASALPNQSAIAVNYQLFISYARIDNRHGHVTELVNRIKEQYQEFAGAPLRVYFDTEEILGFEVWRHRILAGLRDSQLLLVCISPGYLKSDVCQWEFNEYLKHEAGRFTGGEGIAPIYLVEVPGWDKPAIESGLGDWLIELRRRNHFDFRPWIGEGEQAVRLDAVRTQIEKLRDQVVTRVRRGEQAAQSAGNVEPCNPRFIGRVRELSRLREQLALQRVGAMVAIHGLGGMGKTSLAIAYAYAFAHEYGGGRWQVSCEGETDLQSVLLKLQGTRDLSFEFTESERLDSGKQLQRLLSELQQRAAAANSPRCLIILDNVDRAELLTPKQRNLLPQKDWLHVVATTRLGNREISNLVGNLSFLPVDEMPAPDAVDLIESYQPDGRFRNADERRAAEEIVRLLGGFTLAVETTALYLGQNRDVTCKGFLSRLRKEGLPGLDAAAGDAETTLHGEQRLGATLQPTLERLSVEEREVLGFAALLPPDTVPILWLRELAKERYPALGVDAETGYTGLWDRVVHRLASLRLLQPTGENGPDGEIRLARVHRLVQELVRRLWTDEERQRCDQAFENLIASGLEGLSTETRRTNIAWELEVVAGVAEKWADERQSHAAKILRHAARGLISVARWPRAERLLQRALDIDTATYGPEHPDVVSDLNDLGLLLRDTAQFVKAEPLARRAVQVAESVYGPDHAKIAAPLNNLALLLKDTDRPTEAEPLMWRALAILQAKPGPNDAGVAKILCNIAALPQGTGRRADAETLLRRALQIFEATRGTDRPDVSTCLNNLAMLLKDANRFEEAEPLFRRALAIDREIYDPEHPEVAADLGNLGSLLRAAGRLDEAEPLLVRALAIDKNSYGYQHPKVAADLIAYALLLKETNRSEDAELLMRAALDIDRAIYGPEHTEVAADLGHLALLLTENRRFSAAEPLLRRGLAITQAAVGAAHPALIHWLCELSLALSLDGTGRMAEAEALALRALEIVLADRRDTGTWHERYPAVITLYEQLLQVPGADAEAARDRMRAMLASYGVQLPEDRGDGTHRLH
jgi:tetratricopeptide (TPR) repeat protein